MAEQSDEFASALADLTSAINALNNADFTNRIHSERDALVGAVLCYERYVESLEALIASKARVVRETLTAGIDVGITMDGKTVPGKLRVRRRADG